jgi:biotin transport system ATP-binding protein
MIELDAAEVVADTAEGAVRILQATTLTLAESRIALIGANGSGKSTLARLLNGLALPSAGSVRVQADEGWLDTVRDGPAVRRAVSFVFTDPTTGLVMPTVIEDVTLSLRRHYASKADRLAAAHAALDRYGLDPLSNRSVHTLSGGQGQLLAIASALATNPSILVADEPTTLLDLRNSRLLTEQLLALPQQLIVTTHNLELAERCDRVIVMSAGSVVHDSALADGGPAAAVRWYRDHA